MKFSRRVLINTAILVIISAVAVGFWIVCRAGLAPTALYTGATLLGLTLFLALFSGRKKIPFLPLFRASTWLQWHIYLGFFSVLVFLLHIGFRLPTGLLDVVLALVFVGVTASGVGGLILSRSLPRMMNQAGEPIIYERIPRYRKEIRDQVRGLVLRAEETCNSSTLPEFYLEHMDDFIKSTPSLFHSFGAERKRPSFRLTNELGARIRYLSDDEKVIAGELSEWIATKENLDFQESAQRLLRLWLFVHIPLTWSLIILGITHGVLALVYGGSA